MEEVVRLVREAEALLAQGKPVDEVCRGLGISESSLVRWRHKYGGLSSPEAKRLKELERLWQLLKLQVKPRKRHRRRRPRLPIVAGLRASGPNQVWCLDFMKDRTLDGRTVRVLSVVDEYTRECLALAVQPRFLAVDVV